MNLTKREGKGRYSQSFFGVAWAIAQSLATMAVFTLVFSRLAKMDSNGAPYPLFAFAALVPWFFFMNSVTSGTMSLITYRNIVTKTYFPREIIPLAQIASRLIDFASAAALVAVLMIYYGVPVTWWVLMLPVVLVIFIMFTTAVALFSSAVIAFCRDVAPVVQSSPQLWLDHTPVAYSLTRVPDQWRGFIAIIPLSGLIEGFRAALVYGRPPDWSLLAYSAAATLAL